MIVPPIPPAKLSAGPAVKVPYALSLAKKVPPVACGKTKVGVSIAPSLSFVGHQYYSVLEEKAI
jgi:hypothetical protein